VVDPSGLGVWIQSKFNLAGFLGQRIQIRWIGETWTWIDTTVGDYYAPGWADTRTEDGWWLDNIQVTGVITGQRSLLPDPGPIPATACPTVSNDTCPTCCDENLAVTDKGTSVILKVTDLAGNVIDGVTRLAIAGQPLRISAFESSLLGGCSGGVAQYQFFKNGAEAQGWSGKTYFQDAPTAFAEYQVQVRCSSDFSCTSQTGAVVDVIPYKGDGTDIILGTTHGHVLTGDGVRYYRGKCTAGVVPVTLCGPVGPVVVAIGDVPCNTAANCGAGGACGIAAGVADDTTLVCWVGPPGLDVDAYHGAAGPGITIGDEGNGAGGPAGSGGVPFGPPFVWTLNTNAVSGPYAAPPATVNPAFGTCYNPNPAPGPAASIPPGWAFPAPLAYPFPARVVMPGIGGFLGTDVMDPNPPAGYAKYYVIGHSAPPGVPVPAPVFSLGFANPRRCSKLVAADIPVACGPGPTPAGTCGAPKVCLGFTPAPPAPPAPLVLREVSDYDTTPATPWINLCPVP
jgi:hypothetical protein